MLPRELAARAHVHAGGVLALAGTAAAARKAFGFQRQGPRRVISSSAGSQAGAPPGADALQRMQAVVQEVGTRARMPARTRAYTGGERERMCRCHKGPGGPDGASLAQGTGCSAHLHRAHPMPACHACRHAPSLRSWSHALPQARLPSRQVHVCMQASAASVQLCGYVCMLTQLSCPCLPCL